MKLTDLAKAIAPECAVKIVGIRPGEKLHEVLLSEDEARHTVARDDSFIIYPEHPSWTTNVPKGDVPNGFRYASDTNTEWLTVEQLRQML
jgi:UDP-N-acetylglucosamine 4,6-dehydratase